MQYLTYPYLTNKNYQQKLKLKPTTLNNNTMKPNTSVNIKKKFTIKHKTQTRYLIL